MKNMLEVNVTLPNINRRLKKEFPIEKPVMYKGRGYFYFICENEQYEVPSLYVWALRDFNSITEIVDYVRNNMYHRDNHFDIR